MRQWAHVVFRKAITACKKVATSFPKHLMGILNYIINLTLSSGAEQIVQNTAVKSTVMQDPEKMLQVLNIRGSFCFNFFNWQPNRFYFYTEFRT